MAPFALYTAVLLTLSRLYADREMVVLQGAGAGTSKVLSWIAVAGGIVVIGVAALSLHFTPQAQRALQVFLNEQRAQPEFENVSPGVFKIYSQGRRVTYSETISSDRRTLQEVFLVDRLDDGRQVTIWAERARQKVDAATGSQFLILQNGRRYEGRPGSPDYRVIEFEELSQRVDTQRKLAKAIGVEALPLGNLGSSPEEQAELHWRMGLPLFCVIGSLLAVGLAPVKPRQGRFAKVVPGMVTMLAYYLLLLVNRNVLAEGHVPPVVGFWLVHGAFAGFAAWLLRSVGRPVAA